MDIPLKIGSINFKFLSILRVMKKKTSPLNKSSEYSIVSENFSFERMS